MKEAQGEIRHNPCKKLVLPRKLQAAIKWNEQIHTYWEGFSTFIRNY